MTPTRMRSSLAQMMRSRIISSLAGKSRLLSTEAAHTFRCNEDTAALPFFCFSSICHSVAAKNVSHIRFSSKELTLFSPKVSWSFCCSHGVFTTTSTSEKDGQIAKNSNSEPARLSRQRLGPSVRRLLTESGIEIATIKGTGPGGAVVKGDVIAAMRSRSNAKEEQDLKKPPQATSKASSKALPIPSTMLHDDLPVSEIQKVNARRFSQSKSGIPHIYISKDAVVDGTLSLRQELNETYDLDISWKDFLVKAVVSALKVVPEANAHWDDEVGVAPGSSVDISIPIATEKGIMSAILHHADQKSLFDIHSEAKLLSLKAQEGKLQPDDLQGGSFSISNSDIFKLDHFSAIINPPQACHLAVGRCLPSVVWEHDPGYPEQGRPKAVTKVSLTLSADHRVVDVDIGGRFLDALGAILSEPRSQLL